LANEAAMIPFPREEVTPPVTKIYLTILAYNFIVCLLSKIAEQKSSFTVLPEDWLPQRTIFVRTVKNK
jgi:hypothetical protein